MVTVPHKQYTTPNRARSATVREPCVVVTIIITHAVVEPSVISFAPRAPRSFPRHWKDPSCYFRVFMCDLNSAYPLRTDFDLIFVIFVGPKNGCKKKKNALTTCFVSDS